MKATTGSLAGCPAPNEGDCMGCLWYSVLSLQFTGVDLSLRRTMPWSQGQVAKTRPTVDLTLSLSDFQADDVNRYVVSWKCGCRIGPSWFTIRFRFQLTFLCTLLTVLHHDVRVHQLAVTGLPGFVRHAQTRYAEPPSQGPHSPGCSGHVSVSLKSLVLLCGFTQKLSIFRAKTVCASDNIELIDGC